MKKSQHEQQQSQERLPHRVVRSKSSPVKAHHVENLLAQYIEEVFADLFGPNYEKSAGFDLNISLRVEPGENGFTLQSNPPLLDQVRGALKEMETRAGVYRQSRVYCYRCESAECEHSATPRPTAVFSGYSYNGVPIWSELSQVLLDLKDDRIDLLFSEPHGLLVSYLPGRDLKQKLLHEFGKASKTYDILAEVIGGYLPVPIAVGEMVSIHEIAFTLQAVESRGFDGNVRLDLNVLAYLPEGVEFLDCISTGSYRRIYEVISTVRFKLKEFERALTGYKGKYDQGLRSMYLRQIPKLMIEMGRAVEHIGRQFSRRSHHATERIRDNRPVSSATEDTMHAPEEKFFLDVFENTIAVRGPRNRIHIFSEQGVHVTSMVINTDELNRRLIRKRWRLLSPSEVQNFRTTFAMKHGLLKEPE